MGARFTHVGARRTTLNREPVGVAVGWRIVAASRVEGSRAIGHLRCSHSSKWQFEMSL